MRPSRTTLDALLDSGPPGRVLLNLPEWHGSPIEFTHVDDDLLDWIDATGGSVIVTPALKTYLYDRFRKDQVALDRIASADGAMFSIKMSMRQWERQVVASLKEVI